MHSSPDQWCIQARAFRIRYVPCTHNFWALIDPYGRVADQLHGLAFDPVTGQTRAIGSSRDLLQAMNDATIQWSLQPGQPITPCAEGSKCEVMKRWQAALHSLPAINALKLSYPNLWQHLFKKNSNSVFTTLGLIMGFDQPARLLPTFAPGIHLVISDEIVNTYRIRI